MSVAIETPEKQTRKRRSYLERYPRLPQRRYGIEVDRYEDVGRIRLQEGVLPVRSMTPEEFDSVPKEIREQRTFTYPIDFAWNPVLYALARGFPFSGLNPDTRKLESQHRDGRVFEVKYDEQYHRSATFLRMTTPEEEALMGIDRERDHKRAGERMQQILELGFWVRYQIDEDPESDYGTIYERHPDRKIYRVDFDRTKSITNPIQTHVFLRMATPEDDALYNL
jgi:hypothetical protein